MDYGCSLSLAFRFAESGWDVMYFCPWVGAFPKTDRYNLGDGFKEITAVENFWDWVDKVDLIFFPDLYQGDLQHYLCNNGYKVAGAGKSEVLETDRILFYDTLKKLGQPTIPFKVIKGMTKLKEYLKTAEECYVKFPVFRGNFESMRHITYEHSLPLLDKVSHQMGLARDLESFVVQEPVDNAVEVGYDGMSSGGKFPSAPIIGVEVKDKCYVAKILDDYPKLIKKNNDAMASILNDMGMRGLYSTELRVTSPNQAFYIDGCFRMGFPSGNAVSELYKNYPAMIDGLADGEMVKPEFEERYAAEIIISSDQLKHDWLAVDVPKKYKKWMKLKNACTVDGQVFCIPVDDIGVIGSAVGVGDTMKDAIKMALDVAENVKTQDGAYAKDSFDKALETVGELKDITHGDMDLS